MENENPKITKSKVPDYDQDLVVMGEEGQGVPPTGGEADIPSSHYRKEGQIHLIQGQATNQNSEGKETRLVSGRSNSKQNQSALQDAQVQRIRIDSRNDVSRKSKGQFQTLDPQIANDYAVGASINQAKILNLNPALQAGKSQCTDRSLDGLTVKDPVQKQRFSKPSSRYSGATGQQKIPGAHIPESLRPRVPTEQDGPNPYLRHQSIDFLDKLKEQSAMNRQNQITNISQDPGFWMDPSKLSGSTFQNRSPLIQEVKNNNFGKVDKVVGSFIVGSNTSSTVAGGKTQQMNRYLRNSFQPGLMQRERKRLNRSSSKYNSAINSDHPYAVGPKAKANVPKPLVLYQLSKHMDTLINDQSLLNTLQNSHTLGQQLNMHNLPRLDKVTTSKVSTSFQDEGPVFQLGQGIDLNQASRAQHSTIEDQSTRIPPELFDNSQKLIHTKQYSTLDQNAAQLTQNTNISINDPTVVDFRARNSTVLVGQKGQTSRGHPTALHPSPSPALTSFQITDLLEKSIVHGSHERESNKLRQIVEFYKRSVKGDKEMSHRSEIMIRNYRLHFVKDPSLEGIDERAKSLFTLNKGTSIHVSNSILKPEIHKFGTKVSTKLTDVYPLLNRAIYRYDSRGQSVGSSFDFEQMFQQRKRGGSQVGTKSVKSNYTNISDKIYSEAQGYFEDQGRQRGEQPEWVNQSQPVWKEGTPLQSSTEGRTQQELEALAEEGETHLKSQIPISSQSRQRQPGSQMRYSRQFVAGDPAPEMSTTGISSRPITANDAVELEIAIQVNKIFDRWLRNIYSQKSSLLPECPERPKLNNGKPAYPRVKEINWQIALDKKEAIKEKPLPYEKLTQASVYSQGPYQFLQMLVINSDIREWYSRFVLKTASVKSYSQIVHHDLQSMNFQDCKIAIDFSRHHLTHLDPVVFKEDKIPLELFTDFDQWIQPLFHKVRKARKDKELDENFQGIPGKTYYNFSDGSRRQVPIHVCDYDPYSQKFYVQNKELAVATWRSRLYIQLDIDNPDDIQKQKEDSMEQREQSLQYLRVHRLIINEMLKRYGYLQLPAKLLQNIQKRVFIDLQQYDPDSVRKVIVQVEALFVFSVMKSVLDSQRLDPFIKGLLVEYKVPLDSPSLSYFRCKRWEKPELQGIEEYNQKGIKIELDHNSIMLSDEKYLKLPVFLNDLTQVTIGAYKLFSWPFDIEALISRSHKEFGKIKKNEMGELVNTCPLQHSDFVKAQKIMSQYFHHLAKYKWVEEIANQIKSYVQDDFEFDLGNCISEDQIDPCLLRIFYQLKMYMQAVIFDHFETALRDYTKFLLSFILREPAVKDTQVVESIRHNQKANLLIKVNSQSSGPMEGEPINDIDLIRLKSRPFILIHSLIEDIQIQNKPKKKQKIATSPELDSVHKDLFSVILDMHRSLEEIERIDGIVFPLMKLWQPYLMIPDVKNNATLAEYIQIIEKLIEQSLKSTKKELTNMGVFMTIFEKKTDNIIFDLKRASLRLQQELGMAEEEEEEDPNADFSRSTGGNLQGNSMATPIPVKGAAKGPPVEPVVLPDEDEDSYEGLSDNENRLFDDGYQANDMAFKSVEIDEGLMREELYFLRGMIWKILDAVRDNYDFGLVYLDCTKFKYRILGHCKDLVDHLENHLRSDFTAKQKNIQQEIILVRGKLDIEVDSIDDVIMLLDYIESLKTQGNKIGDIEVMIDEMVRKMEYIERVEIKVPDEQYVEYLHMRNWPRTFRHYIDVRKEELLSKKDNLYQEMSQEVNQIFVKIQQFKETIEEVLQEGLIVREEDPIPVSPPSESSHPSLKSNLTESRDGLSKEGAESEDEESVEIAKQQAAKPKPRKQHSYLTFDWLAGEIGMEEMKFDMAIIEENYLRIEQLKQDFDEVERATQLINKRESLLSVGKTQFTDLKVIQDILKPLYELWLVASKFGQILPEWIEGNFNSLDAVYVEMKVEEWINELRRLQKTLLVLDNPKQQELQKFMIDSLNHFQKYTPMLRTLRTKGLAPRHWKMVCTKLTIMVDPTSVTLHELIELKLYDDEKLKTIKQVCEVATKEYSVQQALEKLDSEMRSVEFQFETTQDGFTVVITNLPELISLFEEFFLRISVLKTNPNIKNFFEKLLEIEKIIKAVVELVNEWADFQRNFIYLNGIFVLDEIQKALPHESKFFLQVQGLFNFTSQSFQQNPQVYKVNSRENFLNVLVRSNQDCESIRQGLRQFLERRRGKFPRLFFLSNEELIDVFGKGPDLVDAMISGESKGFITNLFEGVETMQFREETQELTHMQSKDHESIQLVREVQTQSMKLDQWLGNFEQAMIHTMKHTAFLAFESHGDKGWEEWISEFPGQASYLASQIWFTMKIQSIFMGHVERERALRMPNRSLERRLEEDEGEGSDNGTEDQNVRSPAGVGRESGAHRRQLPDLDDDEEEQLEDERLYLEEVHRQVAKDELANPERAHIEKVLRLKERFRVNKRLTPGKQLEYVRWQLQDAINFFTGMVKKRLKPNVRQSTVSLLTCHVHFRDIVQTLILEQVYNKDDFQWQVQFKYNLQGIQDVLHRSAYDKKNPRSYETHKLSVDFEVFNQFKSYGFEYLGNCPRLVVTPLTERCQRSLIIALQYNYGGAPEGPFGTGKTETTKDLSRQIAKLCFVMNCSANYKYTGICRFFKGLASSGAWTCFDEFNRMDTRILSMIAQIIISLQQAIKQNAPQVYFEESKVALKVDCAVFITLNPPGYAGRTELPTTLKALFRPIAMVVPDSEKITEILLYSSGFVGAQQLARKIVSIQSWANKMMKSQGITHDFGLRSIKSIVNIAETIKLQAQNIIESGLTEIIDDKSINRIPYKTDQIIKDVMNETQSDITREVEDFVKQWEMKSKSKWHKKQKKGQDSQDLTSAERPKSTSGSPDSKRRAKASEPDRSADDKSRKGGLFDKQRQGTGSESNSQEGSSKNKKGELYRLLWKKKSLKDRQTRSVYRQIGIFPEQDYDEDELEEYIILKAVRDYNHSKFSQDDHIIIEGIIKDIFQKAVPDLDAPIQDYGNLSQAIDQSFEAYKYDFSKPLKVKVLQFYEIVNTKHGCIFVGDPQSGKTALIDVLQTALNKSALNEYMLTVQDLRREEFIQLAQEYQRQQVQIQISRIKNQGKAGAPTSSDMMGAAVKSKARKTDREAQAKKTLAIYQEMYRKTKPEQDVLDKIKDNLRSKGVISKRMNPKGMTEQELFGRFDELSHEWHEGVFSAEFRAFSKMRDSTKKWLILDGPIDYMWVENLNSILDDNRRMSLPNGEQIKMADCTCVILETNSLRNVTPATVSRCGLIYMHRAENYDTKSLFNQWLRSLPPNLMEYQKEIENLSNYLIIEAIKVYKEDEEAKLIRYNQINLYWLVQSYIRLLTALMFDYFLEYEKSNSFNMGGKNPNQLGESLNRLSFSHLWFEPEEDKAEQEAQDIENGLMSPTSSHAPSQQRVLTPDLSSRDMKSRKRLPRCSFIDSDSRYENAIKYTPIWIEAFVIFSIVWTFYPVLSPNSRVKLDEALKEKYHICRQDFAVYQREKKKRMQEKNKEKNSSMTRLMKGQSMSHNPSDKLQSNGSTAKLGGRDLKFDGLTAEWGWIEGQDEKPMLISNFPEKGSFYDYYFCLDKSDWKKFDVEHEIFESKQNYDSFILSQKKISNLHVPTPDSIRYLYVLECLVTKQTSALVLGSTCSGRSTLMRELLFETVFDFTKQLQTEHITLSLHSDSRSLKRHVEGMMEYRILNPKTHERCLRPPENNKLICYIEDLHMSYTDNYGDQPAIESIRDYLTESAWLSSKKRKIRKLENLSFFACMATNAPETLNVTPRVLHRFNLVLLDDFNESSMQAVFSTLTNVIVADSWPSAVHPFCDKITGALIQISSKVFNHLQATPQKSYYTFSWRDICKIIYSFQMAEGNSIKNEEQVLKLFYHECLRTFGDRLLLSHDASWFLESLKEVCKANFNVADTQEELKAYQIRQTGEEVTQKHIKPFLWPISDHTQLYYSHWNQEVEGFYMEVESVAKVPLIIEKHLERFNDSNERIRVDLILYNQICLHMLKILRIISTPGGHLVNVALKGYGMRSVIRLVTFTQSHTLREIELHEGYSNEEWKNELKRALITCGVDDKPLTFFIDEYKMVHETWYTDLICIIKNNIQTDICRKNDTSQALLQIHKDIEKERRRMRYGLQAEDVKQESQSDRKSTSPRGSNDLKREQEEAGGRMFQKFPYVQAELYRIFLNRIKTNFHLIFSYSPSGPDFRKKIRKHKELLYQSQILFMNDLPGSELLMLGKGYIQSLHDKMIEKRQAEAQTVSERKKQLAWQDKEINGKVLQSIVKMYLHTQDVAKQYSKEQGHHIMYTPVHFLRIFEVYQRLLGERSVVVKEISNRYEAGLKKIKQTQDAIYSYHQDLEKQQPILQNRMRQLYRIINDIEEEYSKIKSQCDQLKRDEFEAEHQTEHALRIKEQCEDTLNKIIPALNQSMNSIESLNKYDIAELRSMKKPPKVVKLVLQIVCLFLQVPPITKKSKKNGELKQSYWKAALGKEVLGNPRLPQLLIEFDRNKVTAETMFKVEEVLLDPNYSFQKAYTASAAATGLFKWVKTTRDYFYIFKEIEPRRDAFMLSQKQYQDKLSTLQEKQARITQLDHALVGLREHQQSKDNIIHELHAQIKECSAKKKRADILLRGLSSEKQKWIVCMRMLSSKYSSVTGDVLLTSGYITMLSGFHQSYRTQCIQKWSKDLGDDGLQCSSEFVFSELFGDSYKIRRWHSNNLPTDVMSVNNALVIEKTKRFSVLVDPQFQGVTWLKSQSEEAGTLMILKQFDLQFKKMMEMAVEMGKTVVIEEIENEFGMNLQSIIKKQISKFGGQRMINFCRKQYKYDKNFRLFIVSSDISPEFDVNVTNHVTLVNFSINLESLQSQMLAMVVLNERSDLENTFTENSKEAFEAIKSLKQIEQAILLLLEGNVSDLLSDENLIQTLEESKNTAEYVALKLKNITATNQFIEKSRDVYTPVAFRASVLYFFAQDLKKLNNMYTFSLSWFKDIFKKSLQLTNTVKNNLQAIYIDPERDRCHTGTPLYKGYQLTIEERIELLTQTFTQEFCKKILIAVFEEDRRLITCMLALRIMHSEALLEPALYKFMIEGPASINPDTRAPQTIDRNMLPWCNDLVWEDLSQLCKIKPFSEENLLNHIEEHQEQWNTYFYKRDEVLVFYHLPNYVSLERDIHLEYGEQARSKERKSTMKLKNVTSSDFNFGKSPSKVDGRSAGQRTQYDDGDTVTSEKKGITVEGSGLRRTESEVLNDPLIWQVSDSEIESEDSGPERPKTTREPSEHGKKEGEKQQEGSNTSEQEVAKYLIDVSPAIIRNTPSHQFMRKCTSTINWKQKREQVIQVMSELCIIRCLRSDQLNEGIDRLVKVIIDKDYFSFKDDIMSTLRLNWKDFKKKMDPNKPSSSGLNQRSSKKPFQATGESWAGSLNQKSSQHSNEKDLTQQTATKAQGQDVTGSVANLTQQSHGGSTNYAQATHKRLKNKDQEKLERERDRIEKRGGLNSITNLIAEAYNDSNAKSPIFFLMVHSVNIYDLIGDFLKKTQPVGSTSAKLQYCTLGQGLEESVEAQLANAAYNGDWILLENLHLVQDWLQVLEDTITRWRIGPDLNPRFRLWATCSPSPDFPQNILNRSIKVAIQPPKSIKAQVNMMVKFQSRDQFFKKSGKHSNFHKNIFFGLVYLHAILLGRKNYGTVGWNIPYKFDICDFEISNAQIAYQMKNLTSSRAARADCINLLRYYFAEINYGGKIQRIQDQITLEALVDDLVNEHISMISSLEPNYGQSHCGFPIDGCPDFARFFDRSIPDIDPFELLGFNQNMFSHLLSREADGLFELMEKVEKKDFGGRYIESVVLKSSIETSAWRITLRNASEKSKDLKKTLSDESSLLNYFISLEKVLQRSSMYLTKETSPFQGASLNHDAKVFQRRDKNDIGVLKIANEIMTVLDGRYPFEQMIQRFPIRYDSPIEIVIHRELQLYKVLVQTIRDSIENITDYILGRRPKSFEVEQLWDFMRDNQVPPRWLQLGFTTAHTSLAVYLSELSWKLDFWKQITCDDQEGIDLSSYWLPAFQNPEAFLNAVAQTRSRAEIVPIKELVNEYQVQDFYASSEPCPKQEEFSLYFHGLWLEGAEWSMKRKMLEETRDTNRFIPFPVVKLSSIRRRDLTSSREQDPEDCLSTISPAESQAKKARQASQSPLKRKKKQEAHRDIYHFPCPVFKSTKRLKDLDSDAVEYLSLPTNEVPRKWIKRGVALVLEPDNY